MVSLNPIKNFAELAKDKPERKLTIEERKKRIIFWRVITILAACLLFYIILYGNNATNGGHQCSNSTATLCLW